MERKIAQTKCILKLKCIKIFDIIIAMGVEFEDALKVADIDKETFERYNEVN